MPIDFDALRTGLEMVKTAIGIAKDAKDLLPDSAQKTTLTSSLSAAERTTAIAEAQIAKGLGYHLCQCTFPPQVMLSKGYETHQEVFVCPKYNKKWPPPAIPYSGEK